MGNSSSEIEEYLKFIVLGVKDMNHLIEDLLSYSMVNSLDDENENILLPKLLSEVEFSLDSSIKERNIKLTFVNIPPEIIGVRVKIKQLFQNLIANAVKFSKSKEHLPRISVSCFELPTHWKFAVKDNGIGISPEFHHRIFRLFQKLHSKHEYKGTGIGLAICKRVVEQHGGEIRVDSEKGIGTTFIFTLSKDKINH